MRKVKFTVSTGYVGSKIEEEFTLDELGIVEEDYETEKELEKDIEEAYDDWLHENINSSWSFVE